MNQNFIPIVRLKRQEFYRSFAFIIFPVEFFAVLLPYSQVNSN